jgi:hypothetical protein
MEPLAITCIYDNKFMLQRNAFWDGTLWERAPIAMRFDSGPFYSIKLGRFALYARRGWVETD